MTEQQLINMGFKKQLFQGEYWFELKMRSHVFITNDRFGAKKNGDWFVGYQNNRTSEEFWFNRNLNGAGEFRILFHVLTGCELKLAHQRKLIK